MEETSVFDVAAFILQKAGKMDTMKLQKLCYYSQAWHLAWEGEALFSEDFEAWANGPVCPPLFKEHKGRFELERLDCGDPENLSQNARDSVEAVLKHYGSWSGLQLGQKTHEERPWLEARGATPPGGRCKTVIEKTEMQDYYAGL